jgi:hypothetical protein
MIISYSIEVPQYEGGPYLRIIVYGDGRPSAELECCMASCCLSEDDWEEWARFNLSIYLSEFQEELNHLDLSIEEKTTVRLILALVLKRLFLKRFPFLSESGETFEHDLSKPWEPHD